MTTSFFALSPILNAYRPIIAKLRDDTGQSVAFGLYEGWKALFVSNAPSRSSVRIGILPTYEFPLYATSIGRVLLASKPDDEVVEHLKSVDMIVRTDRSLKSVEDIAESVRQAREQGCSIVDQEVELGLRSVTVPVRDKRGALVAWININTHVNITGLRELKSKIIPQMLRAADELHRLTP